MRRMATATALRVLAGSTPNATALTRSAEAATRCVLPVRAFSTAAKSGRYVNIAPTGTMLVPQRVAFAAGAVGVQQRMRHVVAHAAATTDAPEETFTYQAEVDRLMDMIVHSLYSNRDVFLRELISNASDALDKERFVSLTKNEGSSSSEALSIKVKGDKANNAIIIEDNGIGMTKEDLLSSLGTIARSGTAKFMEAIKESQGDANLIGQFGVGFYSAFLVSDRVQVDTKSDSDDKQWTWESTAGSHQFKIRESTGEPLQRGTRLTLFLKEDAYEYADDKRLQGLIKQYSEFISFPISLYTSQQERKEVLDEEATAKKQKEAEEEAAKAGKEVADPVEPVMKTEYETKWDFTVQNDTKPLWLRTPREVGKEEYDSFFKGTFKEFMDPAAYNHFNVEGTIEFTGLLFIPGMAPFDQGDPNTTKSRNMRLYVKRVFISDEFDENLMPRYLSFIKGIVDSSDLPLNVSREILQESRVVRVMRKQLVKRSLDMIEGLAKGEDAKAYNQFWDSFGRNLKLGMIEDADNKNTIAKLVRFISSKSGDDLTSLADYVSRMKEGQKGIYYMAADNKATAAQAPFVEKLIAKGYEVLYLVEPIDEVAMANLGEFDGHKLVDVTREELEVDDDDQKKAQEAADKLKNLTEFMKKTLGEKVEKVAVSSRLADSPCALVTSKFGWSANMERIMKSQAVGDSKAMEYMRGRKTLEINPEHPVIISLNRMQGDSGSKGAARSMVNLLYDTAMITSGFSVESPKDFAKRIYDMIGAAAQAAEEVEDEEAAEQAAASSNGSSFSSSSSSGSSGSSNGGSRQPEVVTAEVVEDVNKDDPWRQKSQQ